jgi:hypothetical protein
MPLVWLLLAPTKTDAQLINGSPLSIGSLAQLGQEQPWLLTRSSETSGSKPFIGHGAPDLDHHVLPSLRQWLFIATFCLSERLDVRPEEGA